MKTPAYVFALGAMFCWGLAPLFGKIGVTRVEPHVALLIRNFAVSVILLIWASLSGNLYRIATVDIKSGLFLVLDGLAGALGGALFLYLALKHGETTRVVPITSAFPIVAFAGAVIFLSEKPTLEKLLGTGLILAGLIIIQK